jgi:hypothetical protein
MTLEELQALHDSSDEIKLGVAAANQFEGGIDEINAWLVAEITRQQEENDRHEQQRQEGTIGIRPEAPDPDR